MNATVKEEPAAQPGGDKAEEAKQEAEKLEVKEESSKEAAAADKVPNGEAVRSNLTYDIAAGCDARPQGFCW